MGARACVTGGWARAQTCKRSRTRLGTGFPPALLILRPTWTACTREQREALRLSVPTWVRRASEGLPPHSPDSVVALVLVNRCTHTLACVQ